MKAVVAAFNQEKALVGAFSVITNLRIAFVCCLTTSWCREDGIDVDTASQVTRVAATETQLNTTVLPAYWLRGDGVQSHDSGQLSLVQTWSRVTNRALLLVQAATVRRARPRTTPRTPTSTR